MKTFITETVAEILASKNNISNTICVLPSERAGVFLKEAFKKQLSGTSFLPKIISIEKFIEDVSGIQKIDNVVLLFDFYKVYLEIEQGNAESFDSFSHWASVVLQDFNEIDRHLVDATAIFSYLRDIKRIESWNIEDIDNPSEMVSKHLSFMENLAGYYSALTAYLKQKNFAYQGLIYRRAVDELDHFIHTNNDKNIALIGFNALNKAEETIFKKLLANGVAKAYWDADDYYVNSTKEAGTFLRKYQSSWKYFEDNSFHKITDNFRATKQIHQIAAPKNVTQIKAVGTLLSQLRSNEKTALVLADESLLSLTLNSLPANVDKLNITMGYLLKDMPIASFFEAYFELFLNQQKLNKQITKQFYYKDVFRLLENPLFSKIVSDNNLIATLKQNLIDRNEVFISEAFFDDFFKGNINAINYRIVFETKEKSSDFIETVLDLITQCRDQFTGFERECLFRFYNLFSQLQNLNSANNYIQSLKTLHGVYKQLVATEKMSFQGEPLSGLQLMGMLETRVLDFETVIITSLNEGILPAGKSENSFIPFDVKLQFGLPTYQEKDAIFSYHFYRLLQRAKNVYLFYNTETDAYGAGEKSRFLTQLEVDGIPITQKTVIPKVIQSEESEFQVVKTPRIIEKLKAIALNGFSPSALSKYIEDPIAFYKRYVLGIKEVDAVEETVAANTMGTIIHEVLENFYKPFIGQYVKPEALKELLTNIDKATEIAFIQNFKNGDIKSGKNKLVFEASKKLISKFLQAELKLLKAGNTLKILGTETEIKVPLQIENFDHKIFVKGSIDRIDELNGTLRIVDYKTGRVTLAQLQIPDFDLIPTDYKYTKPLQVMLYAYLYTKQNNFNFATPLESGIICFKNLNAGFLKVNFAAGRKKDNTITADYLAEFLVVVKNMISEIFDPKIPFIENKDKPFD